MFVTLLVTLLLANPTAPLLPAPPKSGYEQPGRAPLPALRKNTGTQKQKKKRFAMEMGLSYNYAKLSGGSFQGLSWRLGFGSKRGLGFHYGISYLFEEGGDRWDLLFNAGLTYNFMDSYGFIYYVRLGYTFDQIAMPDTYITSKKDQMQHGWYGSVGGLIPLFSKIYLYGEVSFVDLYPVPEAGDYALVPGQRGVLLKAGLTYYFSL